MSPSINYGLGVQVFPYSYENLKELFKAGAPDAPANLEGKPQVEYFKEYFSYLAKGSPLTVVAEWFYTDRDFLEDFAGYYVRCFEQKYKSTCTRLHFFKMDYAQADLERLAAYDGGAEHDRWQKAYLGFIVVKPLPTRFVGRTCLVTYDDDHGRRHYPVKRTYHAHLLGHEFRVESLAFQEQDTVAAACASSALWSALQGTSALFQHPIYSPLEVTKIATNALPGYARAFPNKGLNSLQISAAIKATGLEPETLGVRTPATLKATAYAYLRAGIPLVLMARLFQVYQDNRIHAYADDPYGLHAVAITGYSLGQSKAEPHSSAKLNGMLLQSSRIDKLYVQDDQVGPFARLEFGGPNLIKHAPDCQTTFSLRSSWRNGADAGGSIYFVPESLVIPLYHKIRIGFDAILAKVAVIDLNVEILRPLLFQAKDRLEWDVVLQKSVDVKADVRRNGARWGFTPLEITNFLTRSLPRFVWRASARFASTVGFDVLFDATDIEDGNYFIDALVYDSGLKPYEDFKRLLSIR